LVTRYITYDTEFLEDGESIDLISIGLVGDDGREYYAVNWNCNFEKICSDNWLWKSVCQKLPTTKSAEDWQNQPLNFGQANTRLDKQSSLVKPKWVIANEVRDFIGSYVDDTKFVSEDSLPQLWAYYGAYDHVALAQLWGKMIDLPQCVPMFTHELKQLTDSIEYFTFPTESGSKHNALEDARWNMEVLRRARNWPKTAEEFRNGIKEAIDRDTALSQGPW